MASARDLPELVTLVQAVKLGTGWSEASLAASILNPLQFLWLARDQSGHAAGLLVAQFIQGEAEILNIAVAPTSRRQGLAKALLAKLFREAEAQGVGRIILEVRVTNEAAISLYRAHGFSPIGVRKAYYQPEGTDAVVMERSLI